MQSVLITTNELMFWVRIPLRRGVLDTTLCEKVCQWLAAGRWFSRVSSTNKTDRHDITEILMKVALNTIKSTYHLTSVAPLSLYYTIGRLWSFTPIQTNGIIFWCIKSSDRNYSDILFSCDLYNLTEGYFHYQWGWPWYWN